MQEAATSETPSDGEATQVVGMVEYVAVIDEDNPEATGHYACAEKYQRRLTNFVAKIEEERLIGDVDEADETRRFRGTIHVHGTTCGFDISSKQFSEELRSEIFATAGARAEILGSIDEIRTAISRNSEPVVRRYLTSMGWTDDFSKYLVPGGYVDRDGYHETADGDGVPAIELPVNGNCRWLGLRQLDPEQLRQANLHIIEDLMGLNQRPVVWSMLAGVVLSVMIRQAEVGSRPILWFEGVTGSGKSTLACLCENFFGDFGGPGSGRHLSWTSTINAIQSAGYHFRDAPFAVDDYKREHARHSAYVMVLQCYSDRTGRARLNSDTSMNTTRPIRGLLMSTAEDFPENNASGRGRAVVIKVPIPTGFDLRSMSWEMAREYRPRRTIWSSSAPTTTTGCTSASLTEMGTGSRTRTRRSYPPYRLRRSRS